MHMCTWISYQGSSRDSKNWVRLWKPCWMAMRTRSCGMHKAGWSRWPIFHHCSPTAKRQSCGETFSESRAFLSETQGNSGDLSAKRVFSVLVFFSCVQVGFQYLLMLRSYVLFVALRWGKLSLLQLLSYQWFFVCSEFHVKDIVAMQANDRS